MTDRFHRFRLEIAGQTLFGVAFATETELEEFLGTRGLDLARPAAPADAPSDETRARGRPSFAATITAAVTAIETDLDGCNSVSDRARLVLRHMARSHSAEHLPSIRTLTTYLADEPVGKKAGNKYGRKSKRAKLGRTGGT